MGLGSVLGYLIAGAIIGPFGLSLFSETKAILHFAEIGIVLLLFVIGLELNIQKLLSMKRDVFGVGSAQLFVTGLLLIPLVYFIGQSSQLTPSVTLILALTLALSSTAFAIQMLQEKNELNTAHGQTSFAVLLFQDLAAIPLLAIVPLLKVSNETTTTTNWLPALKAIGMIVAVILVGRYLLRHALRLIALSKSKEVFTAASLLLVIGVALLMSTVGLSMALGAFLAGVILADSEYRHELEADIEPFKGLLLGLFFMAVGMTINLELLFLQPLYIVALTLVLMLLKIGSLLIVGRLFKFNFNLSKNVGLILCQGGEFGFVIFAMSTENTLIDKNLSDLLVLIVTISMALTPIVMILNEKIFQKRMSTPKPEYDKTFDDKSPAVIIAGFGRFGQIVARILRIQKVPFTTLEHSPDNVETARKFGNRLYYGDASRVDLLHAAGADKAKLFVLAIDNVESSVQTAKVVREHFPHLKIYARARNRQHVFELMSLGVTIIKRETLGSSLELAQEALIELGTPSEKASSIITKFREHDEKVLQEQYKIRDDEKLFVNRSREMNQQLEQLLESDK